MKIAFVYDCIYPYIKGGAEKRIWEIAKRLAIRGHDVHIYGFKWWNGQDIIIRDGVKLHGVCSPAPLYSNGKRSTLVPIYFAIKLLIPLLKEKFDVIDCQEFPFFPCLSTKIYSKLKKVFFIITWYETWDDYWFEYLGKLGLFGWIIERAVLQLPDAIIPISGKIKDDLLLMGVPNDIMYVVPNGVNFSLIDNLNYDITQCFDILYVGRLISHKNVDILIRAISLIREEYPSIKCCIIGDGPEKEKLNNLSNDLGLGKNIVFLGFIEKDEDVYRYMHSSKIFILPSTREGFPNTILEANSCGLPAIIVEGKKNAATYVIKDGYNGYILELSPKKIADQVVRLLKDPYLMETLKDNARTYAKNYDWILIVAELERVYKDVIS